MDIWPSRQTSWSPVAVVTLDSLVPPVPTGSGRVVYRVERIRKARGIAAPLQFALMCEIRPMFPHPRRVP